MNSKQKTIILRMSKKRNRKVQSLSLLAVFFILSGIFFTVQGNNGMGNKQSRNDILPIQEPNTANISIVSSPDWDRDEIVWNSGYWQTATSGLKPWDSNPAFGIALMYEPLFGYDYITDQLIPVIGTNINWNDEGDQLTVGLNPFAEWSDGQNIDPSDVKFSYDLAVLQPKWQDEMQEVILNVTAGVNMTVTFFLNPGHENSSKIIEFITRDIPIIPEHVWTEINATESSGGDLSSFKNDWFDAGFDPDWMVCSGPYAPHFFNITSVEEVYMFRDDWWGLGVIYNDLPNAYNESDPEETGPPKYIGKREYSDNDVQNAALNSGDIDCFSTYYANVWELMENNSNIGTFFGKDYSLGEAGQYFLALGSILSVSPNHLIYPLNETWFREAIAHCIDYDRIPSHAASNYTRRAKQGFIDGTSPSQEDAYNQTIQDIYGVDYNLTLAQEIMDDYCTFTGGKWVIDESGVTIDAAGIRAFNGLTSDFELSIINPSGWTDTALTCDYWAEDISTLLGITISHVDVDFAIDYIPDIEADDFFMAMQTAGPRQADTTLRLLASLRGESLWNQNSSNWYSQEYEALYQQLTVQARNPTAQAEIASQMQELLATEFPEIPSHNNGFWYLYSDQYWDGWISDSNLYNQLVSVYTVDEMAIKARLYLNLRTTGYEVPEPFVLSADTDSLYYDYDGDFYLNWTPCSGAENYTLYMNLTYTPGFPFTYILTENSPDLSYHASGGTEGIYYFMVEADCDSYTIESNVINVTIELASEEQPSFAWQDNGVLVSGTLYDQRDPCIITDGAGGAIIAWNDSRNDYYYDIYAQKLNSDGTIQWTEDDVAVCTANYQQYLSGITSDGAGGAIIAWMDYRNGNFDIYAQRINASGVVQWTENGVAVCTAIDSQYIAKITSDGVGGAIITWEDERNENYDIYAQRINASGVVQWTENGEAICITTTNQVQPEIVSDGEGGAIITWLVSASGNSHIYAQRINSIGAVQWTTNGVAICTEDITEPYLEIISDGFGGAIITWGDPRNGNQDIYAQKINASGKVQWTVNGVVICATDDTQKDPDIVSDGVGGAIIAWNDGRPLGSLYVQRISSSGTLLWAPNGVMTCSTENYQYTKEITSDGAGGAIVVWYEYRTVASDIFAQRINSNGVIQWTTDGTEICKASGYQNNPVITCDGTVAIVAWVDFRNGNEEIFAQKIENIRMQLPGNFTLQTDAGSPDTDGIFTLSWTPSAGAMNYTIYKSDIYIESYDGNQTILSTVSYYITTIPVFEYTDGTYFYLVVASNYLGQTTSQCINVTVLLSEGPQPPGYFLLGIDADDPDPDGSIWLMWSESPGADNYSIYMRLNLNSSLMIVEIYNGLTNRQQAITNLNNGEYSFQVIAFNEYGNYTSNWVDVTIGIPGEDAIPGFNILMICSGIGIVSILILKKKFNK